MTDFRKVLADLRRPRLLIRAARFGLTDYRRERDLRRIVEVAHALKSSAANIMASRLAELARQTEHAARDGRPEALILAASLKAAIADTAAEIEKPEHA